jgi:S1-C subfamily serine protease
MSSSSASVIVVVVAALVVPQAGCRDEPIYPLAEPGREVERVCPPSVVGVYVVRDGTVITRGTGFIAIENLPRRTTTRTVDGDRTQHVCGVVTDARLTQDQGTIYVEFADSRERHAVAARYADKSRDLALLEVRYRAVAPRKSLPFSNREPQVGDPVFALSANEGLQVDIALGKVAGRQPSEGIDCLQTTCPIASQGPGGPIVNEQGHVIGIMRWAQSETATTAITADVIRAFLSDAPKKLQELNQWMEDLRKPR